MVSAMVVRLHNKIFQALAVETAPTRLQKRYICWQHLLHPPSSTTSIFNGILPIIQYNTEKENDETLPSTEGRKMVVQASWPAESLWTLSSPTTYPPMCRNDEMTVTGSSTFRIGLTWKFLNTTEFGDRDLIGQYASCTTHTPTSTDTSIKLQDT